jgi:hypothetical protein
MSNKTVSIPCARYNHPDFQFIVNALVPHEDVSVLVSYLQDSVQEGKRYEDGEMMQFGSMLFRFVKAGDFLILQEPDLRAIPIVWTDGITNSMKLLRLQKDVAESVDLGDAVDFPSIRGSLLVGADWAEASDTLVIERSEPEGLDSGWFVGRIDTRLDYNDPANLRRVSVYQAILDAPRIAGFLALPAGCRIEIARQSTTLSYRGQALTIRKGSFLDVACSGR